MGDELAHVQFAGEDQAGNFFLQKKIGGITAQQLLFIHADGGQINGRMVAAFCMGEQEELTATAKEGLGLKDGGV